jgi:YHS domain-containing protein
MTTKLLLLTALTATLLLAQAAKPVYTTDDGTAIHGYDVVAYQTSNKATKGSTAHTFEWNGAKWLFASAANRERFISAPEKYAPQYGGYCAFGMSRGYKAAIDPQAFTVLDGKLYLNYNPQVQETWRKDTAGYIRKAGAQWPTVKASPKVAK